MIYICVSARNNAATVGLVLWKVRQVFEEFSREYRLLVADDGSTDGTVEFVNSLGGYVTYIRQKGMFLPNARNCGILKSTGEIVAFLDDDAIPSYDWLEEIIKTYEMDEMVGGVGSRSNGIL